MSGDGGFLMNSQELETAVRLGVAITPCWCYAESFGMRAAIGRTFRPEEDAENVQRVAWDFDELVPARLNDLWGAVQCIQLVRQLAQRQLRQVVDVGAVRHRLGLVGEEP